MIIIDIFFTNEDGTQELIGAMSEVRKIDPLPEYKDNPTLYIPYTRFDRKHMNKISTQDNYIGPKTQKMPIQIVINKEPPVRISNAWIEDTGYSYSWEDWVLVPGIILVAESIEGPIF